MSASSPSSPRASMIAVPCSPIEPESEDPIAGPQADRGRAAARGSRRPRPVVQMYMPSAWPRSTTLVSPATIWTSASRAARSDRLHLLAQRLRGQALLEHERERQRERTSTGHREVVDGPVDRELADRATGEAQRLDDERVGGERQLAAPSTLNAPASARASSAGRVRRRARTVPRSASAVALPPAP